MKSIKFLSVLLGLLAVFYKTPAQSEAEILAQLLDEERSSMEALVLYPEETRLAILESAKYPELLIKLESMQTKTSASFKALMEKYPKETQEMIWDLTRYPGLITKLTTSAANIDEVLQIYPEEVHERAKTARRDHFTLLNNVHNINREWDAALDKLLENYAPVTRNAIHTMINLPEVMTVLTDNIRMTVLVGDLYKKNPDWLLQRMDSLNLVVARERTKELEAWKKSLDENPQAKDELISSAESYADEYGYDDSYYNYDDDLYYHDYEVDNYVVEHHYYYHYPYWFGYPYWYLYPRWRPYPYWYDWGFYFGPGRVIVIIDLPSFYFTNWYFYYPHHHYYYPHLSSHFVNHYYGHRAVGSSITVSVEQWRTRNREVITTPWLERARTSTDVFKEYGAFENARERYNVTHRDKPMSPAEYLDKNTRRYPTLAEEFEEKRRTEQQPDLIPPADHRPTDPPAVKQPAKREPVPPSRKPETKAPDRRKGEVIPPKTEVPKVDKAQEYHRGIWEKRKNESPRKDNPPALKNTPGKQPPKIKPGTKSKNQPDIKQPARKKSKGNGNR
jgi:hypothetical protein